MDFFHTEDDRIAPADSGPRALREPGGGNNSTLVFSGDHIQFG